MTTSTQKVLLQVFDCLEIILLELPPATLLTCAQRVCKTWHNTIAISPPLQRKLFLSPSSGREGTTRTPNPLLASAFPRFFTTDLYDHAGLEEVLNPLRALEGVRGLLRRKTREPSPFLRSSASWRRMFPEYPVTFKLGFIEVWVSGVMAYYSGALDVPGGVTMGKLFDTAYTMFLGRYIVEPRFAVYWREQDQDPRVTPSSYMYGREEIALSKFPSDVKIVILAHVYNVDGLTPPESREELDQEYMPADLEFCPVDLQLVSSQFD